jgi:hypothetical protein
MRLEQDRAQPAGERIHGHAKAGRPAANDHHVPFSFIFKHVQKLMPIHKPQVSRVYAVSEFFG